MTRKPTNIDTFAKILIDDLPSWQRPGLGEMTYVATGARLIQEQLREFYKNAGLEPPQFKTVRSWFYYGCPDWTIAVLHNVLGVKSDAGDLVTR